MVAVSSSLRQFLSVFFGVSQRGLSADMWLLHVSDFWKAKILMTSVNKATKKWEGGALEKIWKKGGWKGVSNIGGLHKIGELSTKTIAQNYKKIKTTRPKPIWQKEKKCLIWNCKTKTIRQYWKIKKSNYFFNFFFSFHDITDNNQI